MITKDKNKSKISTKSKILVLGLILIILAGIFSPLKNTQAQGGSIWCKRNNSSEAPVMNPANRPCEPGWTQVNQDGTPLGTPSGEETNTGDTTQDNTAGTGGEIISDTTTGGTTTQTDAEKKAAEEEARVAALFGTCNISSEAIIEGCIVRFFYLIFITLGSKVLYMAAYVFNIMLSLSLSTVLYENNFLPEAWRIVRDFSNIFFILVLLYISIKMILGLGGSEIKKMIVQVILAALLINFSMFMTRVVIDSSNILALIFYNKIAVNPPSTAATAVGAGTAALTGATINDGGIPYLPATDKNKTQVEEKDIAGGIVAGFNPTNFLNPANNETFKSKITGGTQAGTGQFVGNILSYSSGICLPGTIGAVVAGAEQNPCAYLGEVIGGLIASNEKTLPASVALAIIFTGGAVFLFAAYAFFVAGLAFIGRLIELWMLIIFSPFAFMSLSLPNLQKLDYLGWDKWLKRLIDVSFMAPIFMFFILIITKLVQINILGDISSDSVNKSVTRALIMLVIPAIIYITLLYKATEFAKKGAGEFGSAVIKYGQMAAGIVGGLALTAASGGTSLAIGGGFGTALNYAGKKAGNNFVGNKLRDAGGFLQNRSFDVRNIKTFGIGDNLSKAGLGKGRDKSWTTIKEKQNEKHKKRAAELEKRWTGGEKKEVEKAKADLAEAKTALKTGAEGIALENAQAALKAAELPIKTELDRFDKLIAKHTSELNEASKAGDAARISAAKSDLNSAKVDKEILRSTHNIHTFETRVRTAQNNYNNSEARTILPLEKALADAQRNLDKKSGEVVKEFANQISSGRNKIWEIFKSGGLYSTAQANTTATTIRQNAKTDSGKMHNPPLTA